MYFYEVLHSTIVIICRDKFKYICSDLATTSSVYSTENQQTVTLVYMDLFYIQMFLSNKKSNFFEHLCLLKMIQLLKCEKDRCF